MYYRVVYFICRLVCQVKEIIFNKVVLYLILNLYVRDICRTLLDS